MLAREEILQLVPHQGDMCLWDEVLTWAASDITLRTFNHRDPAHPLRSNGQLRAIHLCEYGAQAMAVHGGLRARERGGVVVPGVLVALREVQLHVARIDDLDGAIEATAQVLAEAETSQQYSFRIVHRARVLAEGRAAVMLQPGGDGNNMQRDLR